MLPHSFPPRKRRVSLLWLAANALLFFTVVSAFAPVPPTQQTKPFQAQGRIVDGATTSAPIRSASVYMKHLADGISAGDIADSAGRFTVTLENLGFITRRGRRPTMQQTSASPTRLGLSISALGILSNSILHFQAKP
jgi:hypothetical protein